MADDTARIADLEARVETLGRELGRMQDEKAIRTLQHTYGYFMDKGLYDEVVDLFAEDGELRFMGGVFKGKAGATWITSCIWMWSQSRP